jgi:hypothetical protein
MIRPLQANAVDRPDIIQYSFFDFLRSPAAISRKDHMINTKKGAICSLLLLLVVCGVTSGAQDTGELCEVDCFTASGKAGKLEGWASADDTFHQLYTIAMEGDNYFLQARARRNGSIIAKEMNYNLKEFPVISWRWRAHTIPRGGDERYKKSGDSAAGIYVIFPSAFKPEALKNRWGISVPIPDAMKPECIKYVWSASLPPGTVTDSPYSGKTKIVVLQNGSSSVNRWMTEEVNAYEDYKRLFKKEPGVVRAVGILTDADDTASEAGADYDDIFLKKASSPQVKQQSRETHL